MEEEIDIAIIATEPAAEPKMVLRTDSLVKKYGQRTVVNHVSIDVPRGGLVVLPGLTAPARPPRSI